MSRFVTVRVRATNPEWVLVQLLVDGEWMGEWLMEVGAFAEVDTKNNHVEMGQAIPGGRYPAQPGPSGWPENVQRAPEKEEA